MMKGIRDHFGLRAAMAMALAVAALGTGGCRRSSETDGGFTYTAGLFSAEVTGVAAEGQRPDGMAVKKEQTPRRLEVPKRLGGKRVGSVAARAFWQCAEASSIKIPGRVSKIGAEAFAGCPNLLWVELPSHLTIVEDGLFADCPSMRESDIPERVESIGARAYAGCVRLERVALPERLRSVGDEAFAGCASLRALDLPAGLGTIGKRSFAGCGLLERIELPEGVQSVGEGAFAGCGRLLEIAVVEGNAGFRSVGGALYTKDGTELLACPAGLEGAFAVPDGVRAIAGGAFANCGLLESVSIPASVERIGARAFAGCTGLKSVEVAEGNPAFLDRDGVLFGDGGAELLLFPPSRGGSYTVPGGVKRIAPDAFRGAAIERMTVPGGVESIGAAAFRDCRHLHRVELEAGVAELGEEAFAGCTSLWAFEMPASVERAGEGLFAGCGELRVVVAPDALLKETSAGAWQAGSDCKVFSPAEWEVERRKWRSEEADDPFFGLYGEEDLQTVAFEGTVLAASAMPDPARNDYDHCLAALLVEIDSVLSSAPPSESLERTVLVNVPVMKDKVLVQANRFGPGDRIACLCADYDAMPQAIREIQLSDDIQSFEHQPYYAMAIRKTGEFRTTGHRDFAKREIAVIPVQSLPRDAGAEAARRTRIQGEIARIERELEEHGGSFEAWKEEYRPVAEEYARLCAEGFKGWIGDSYFAVGGPETTYDTKAYVEGLIPYKKYLEENNIDLVVLRIPTKWDFAARVLAADDFQENPAWVEHYYECLKNDIEIVDPMPEMWKERFDFPLFYCYRVPEEFHPFEGMSFVGAKVLAGVLERYPYRKSEGEITVTNAVFDSWQERYFWPAGNGKFDPAANIAFRQVFRDGQTIGGLWERSGSPFLFLSNSYFWFPQRPVGASIPGYAAYFLQALPDWVHQDGAHNNTLMRALVSTPGILDGRRVVVMVGDPGYWNGFPPLPKYIRDRAKRISLEKTLPADSDEIAVVDGGSFRQPAREDGSVMFIQNDMPPGQGEECFALEFGIPRMEGKRTCMVRLNFEKTFPVTLDLLEAGSDAVLDSCFLVQGKEQSADFFVPVAGDGARAKILFKPRMPQKECTLKNIELWYY